MSDEFCVSSENSTVTEAAEPQNESPTLQVDCVDCFNYAAWLNAVPIIRSLKIENSQRAERSKLTLELVAAPNFVNTKRWAIDRLSSDDSFEIQNVDLEMNPEYLNNLDESVRGTISFRIYQDGDILTEVLKEVRVLTRDEWGGMGAMAQLLPAFVTPNTPALVPILRDVSDVLDSNGHSGSLDGYQSGDPNRVYMLAAALWSAISTRELIYANPPASFERVGQKTRSVARVLQDGLATCLDSTLLFASGLEAIGLNPVIVVLDGHCVAGVWLIKRTFRKLVEKDVTEVRKALASKELILFETTQITSKTPVPFTTAIQSAAELVGIEREDEFHAAIDISRGRMSQILPIATHVTAEAREETESNASPVLPDNPGITIESNSDDTSESPTTPAGRIERWQRKLLDLSLRNRLLNFKNSKQSIPVISTDLSRLEDLLADGEKLRIVSLPENDPVGNRDADLHRKRNQKDIQAEYARQALEKNEVLSPLEKREMESRLTALYRKARNDMAEGGSNTLFLALGFLRWKQSPSDSKCYMAPLLLVPAQLNRRSASAPFYLSAHEDDVQFNATLLQMLKKDFDCDLTNLETNLPKDESGIALREILDRMRRSVREIPGFEVVEEAAIAPFSFAKYLMWRDLVERTQQLQNNRVVRHLIQDPDKPFQSEATGSMPHPAQMDHRYAPRDIVHPLPADSSQLSAVMAASEGHDLVIVGPPGTGKSQTIANLIAQSLAIGKTVLFVAEKTAALDVVHRRLKEHGLGDCCVELHSNKAEKRKFLDQLQDSWTNRVPETEHEWIQVNEKLLVKRNQLNAYADALHELHSDGWTAYQAMGKCIQGREWAPPKLEWNPNQLPSSRENYLRFENAISKLTAAFNVLPAGVKNWRLKCNEWSMAWETKLFENSQNLNRASTLFSGSLQSLATLTNLECLKDFEIAWLSKVFRLASEISKQTLPPEELLLRADLNTLKKDLRARSELIECRNEIEREQAESLVRFCQALSIECHPTDAAEKRTRLLALARSFQTLTNDEQQLLQLSNRKELRAAVDAKPGLESNKLNAVQVLQSRSFNPNLIEKIPVEDLTREWVEAGKSIWPFSKWKTQAVEKKLAAYMLPDAAPHLEVDIPLLLDLRDAVIQLEDSTGCLKQLSAPLRALLTEDLVPFEATLSKVEQLEREIVALQGRPERVSANANANAIPLPIVDLADKALHLEEEKNKADNVLDSNLAGMQLSRELQTVVVNEDSDSLNGKLSGWIDQSTALRAALDELELDGETYRSALRSMLGCNQGQRRETALACCRAAKDFQDAWKGYVNSAGMTPVDRSSPTMISDSISVTAHLDEHRESLRLWSSWSTAKASADSAGLTNFVDALEAGEIEADELLAQFRVAYARWRLPQLIDQSEALRTFQKYLHENAVTEFRRLDEEARRIAAPRARLAVYHGLPPAEQVPRKSELGLLRHQVSLKRPNKSIREMIVSMPDSFHRLAPCLLMSPLSIAQYLPANHAPFDIVIFDEASQIATWDAIGAIARAKQTIIVGDPKQLPPTNFFGKAESEEETEGLEEHEKDLESILDEAQASGIPTLQLNWHYRSKHESLIAFSNWNYYGNRLITFPAAESIDRGVSLRIIKDAIYDRGKTRTNRTEAQAIVADLAVRMQRCLAKEPSERLTYGVVTFNSQQQELIQDLIDEMLREHPALEWFFSDDRIEPTVVKNLENVQGDERDVMMFSITFGFDIAGKFPATFGAINKTGGERRLNVAVTRARQELVVFSSFMPDQMKVERSSAKGVHDLKAFLDYADKGPEAMAQRIDGSMGSFDSPFEEAVASSLERKGWQVETQIGVSGFRIDLGIVHPDRPGAYLAGIECDGATYHRSAIARDRDKIRQQVLENLGWSIERIWSTDWWYAPDAALEDIDAKLRTLLQAYRDQSAMDCSVPITDSDLDEAPKDEEPSVRAVEPTHSECDEELASDADSMDDSTLESTAEQELQLAKGSGVATFAGKLYYERADIDCTDSDTEAFFSDAYTPRLRQIAREVLELQSPIRDDVLVREVARAHGFLRAGIKIRQRILEALGEVTQSDEKAGLFFWKSESVSAIVPFRYPKPHSEKRQLDEISDAEIHGLIQEHPHALSMEDPALWFAREIGVGRFTTPARLRLEEAISTLTT